MKKMVSIIVALMLSAALAIPAFAGQWAEDSTGWWWQRDDGTWPAAGWELCNGTWYVFDVNGYWIDPDKLAVGIDPSTVKSGKNGYTVQAEYQIPIPAPSGLKNGKTVTITTNEVTGKTEKLVYRNNRLFAPGVQSYDSMYASYEVYNGILWYANASDDIAYKTVYEGPLYIRNSVKSYYIPLMQMNQPIDFSNNYIWLNGVKFDSDGYVTQLVQSGD